jgi:transglutaminase-like putative cysteine protease
MRLRATCEIKLKANKSTPLIAMLRPRSGEAQWIASESYDISPFSSAVEYVDTYGNLCQRMLAPADQFTIRTDAVLEVAENIAVSPGAPLTQFSALPDYALQFLLPSRYCPSDMMVQLASEVTANALPGYDQVEAIRSWIHKNIAYQYGVSNASTSALDTVAARAGVCRDFAHIGLSLCRALQIPARMVVGYLYQLDPMDLHAWFEAYVGGNWFTFDATQVAPRGGRIALAYGRDAADVALITELGSLTTESMQVTVELAN